MTSPNTQQHFLLVDDDEVFCSILSRALERREITTSTANSPQQAIELIQQLGNIFSHAVIDLNMGKESGLALIPQLLNFDAQLKIIVLTGYSSIATTVEAIKRGASNYLCKPASVDEILAAFNENNINEQKLVSSKPLSVDRLEWEYIQKTLAENDGNVSATARALGMHRRTLQRKLQKKPVQE
ncbi:MAG TPA: two-component system response regulator [Cellvibrionales bacterium]|jgi:two-component system response regulator RegA|nr:two-component system response regulator [Cellvibrionales bacterium]